MRLVCPPRSRLTVGLQDSSGYRVPIAMRTALRGRGPGHSPPPWFVGQERHRRLTEGIIIAKRNELLALTQDVAAGGCVVGDHGKPGLEIRVELLIAFGQADLGAQRDDSQGEKAGHVLVGESSPKDQLRVQTQAIGAPGPLGFRIPQDKNPGRGVQLIETPGQGKQGPASLMFSKQSGIDKQGFVLRDSVLPRQFAGPGRVGVGEVSRVSYHANPAW